MDHRYFVWGFLSLEIQDKPARRAGLPSLGDLWGKRAGAAERICLFMRTKDPEQESRPGYFLAELDGRGLQFSETHFSHL